MPMGKLTWGLTYSDQFTISHNLSSVEAVIGVLRVNLN